MKNKIVPCLWFDKNAEEAVNFYLSVFQNGKINHIERYDEESSKVSGQPAGSIMTIDFEMNDQEFVALNGGPVFKFNEAISFVINCQDQDEIDYYWAKLTENGGHEVECGWLKDKYGLSWQVVPQRYYELVYNSHGQTKSRVVNALLSMKKIIIADLEKAYGKDNS